MDVASAPPVMDDTSAPPVMDDTSAPPVMEPSAPPVMDLTLEPPVPDAAPPDGAPSTPDMDVTSAPSTPVMDVAPAPPVIDVTGVDADSEPSPFGMPGPCTPSYALGSVPPPPMPQERNSAQTQRDACESEMSGQRFGQPSKFWKKHFGKTSGAAKFGMKKFGLNKSV